MKIVIVLGDYLNTVLALEPGDISLEHGGRLGGFKMNAS